MLNREKQLIVTFKKLEAECKYDLNLEVTSHLTSLCTTCPLFRLWCERKTDHKRSVLAMKIVII